MTTMYKEDNELVLLNDTHVTYALNDSISDDYGVPKVTSHKLVVEIENNLSGHISSTNNNLSELKTSVETSAALLCSEIASLNEYVDGNFLNLSGGTISGWLKVQNNALLNGDKTIIRGKLVQGQQTNVQNLNSTVFGVNTHDSAHNQFVWNGINEVKYEPSETHGSFNVNPENGVKGFFIGDNTLCNIIHTDVTGYADSTLSDYALKNNISIDYDTTAKKIFLSADGFVTSIKADDFIKDGMLSTAQYVTERYEGEHYQQGRWLKLIFNTYAQEKLSTETVYVDINDLVPIAGDGLSDTISGRVPVLHVNWNQVARAEQVSAIQNYVNELSTPTGIIDTVSSDISSLKDINTKNLKFVGILNHDLDVTEISDELNSFSVHHPDELENCAFIRVRFNKAIEGNTPRTVDVSCNGEPLTLNDDDYLIVYEPDFNVKYIKTNAIKPDVNLFIDRSNVTFADISDLNAKINVETARAEQAEDGLSTAISSKVNMIFIGDELSDASSCNPDLSVIKLSNRQYNDLVLSAGGVINESAVYIIDDDYIDARGQVLSNLMSATIDSAAATFGQLRATSVDFDERILVIDQKLSDEIIRAQDVENTLSTKIYQKVFISSYLSDDSVSSYNDLSIIKLQKDEYDTRVASGSPLSGNVLYVVDSDYIDAYGQQIKNVSMDEEPFETENSYLGIAATDKYVQKVSNDILVGVNVISTYLSNQISLSVSNIITGDNTYTGKNLLVNDTEICADKFVVTDVLSANWIDGNVRISLPLFVNDEISSNNSITCAGEITVNHVNVPGLIGANLTTDYGDGYLKLTGERLVSGGETKIIDAKIDYPEKSGTIALITDVTDAKVTVLSSYDIKELSGEAYPTDLSVVHVTNEEYDKLVVDEKTKDTMLYVIKDDFIDARGQTIQNLLVGDSDDCAVSKGYVDAKTKSLNNLAFALSSKINTSNPTLDDLMMTIIQYLSAI